jgi:acyl phosphate:glycerol-3-phosphate acyltransferase
MTGLPLVLALAALAYFVGAIPIGYLVARLRGVDIVHQGSGNIGATNVGRVLGMRYGLIVFVLDFAKGALPTLAAGTFGEDTESRSLAAVAAGFAAFLGHLFPVYLGFRGGKGVATGAGVVAVLLPGPTFAALVTWIAAVSAWRYVSLASMLAALALCATRLITTYEPFSSAELILTLFALFVVLLVVVKHRQNIGRLLGGNENRIPDGPTMRALTKTVHVLAVGMWFGMAVFFSFPVALTLFSSFEKLAEQTERPLWFPLPDVYSRNPAMQKEQGTRAAGVAVGPIFDHYFLWQGVCGLLAVGTALGWSRAEPGKRIHRGRAVVLMVALATIAVGWPLEQHVSGLRVERNAASDRLLESTGSKLPVAPNGANHKVANEQPMLHGSTSSEIEELQAKWDSARAEFGRWHLWSLLLNMVTIGLVTIAMALAGHLPAATRASVTAT